MLATFTATQWLEVIVAITLPLSVIGFVVHRAVHGGPITGKAIQVFGILQLIPAVLILALENHLSDPVLGTLLGAFGGCLLSNIGRDVYSAPRAAESAPRAAESAPRPSASA